MTCPLAASLMKCNWPHLLAMTHTHTHMHTHTYTHAGPTWSGCMLCVYMHAHMCSCTTLHVHARTYMRTTTPLSPAPLHIQMMRCGVAVLCHIEAQQPLSAYLAPATPTGDQVNVLRYNPPALQYNVPALQYNQRHRNHPCPTPTPRPALPPAVHACALPVNPVKACYCYGPA
jgi:hypothetical protein